MRDPKWASVATIVLATTFVAVAVRYAFFVAAISDSSGYVSEASRWLVHDLFGPQPFAFWPAWPDLSLTTPLAYRAGTTPGTDVFVYPPGLPLTLAAAMAIGGSLAAHVVPPLMGGLLVWATGDLAGRLAGPSARLIAAALMATSAIAFTLSLDVMSDVPVSAWWMLSLVFAPRRRPLAMMASGLVVSMAILTRPNLAPLAIIPGVLAVLCSPGRRWWHGTIFFCTASVGPALLLWLQATLYGSPLASGYGAIQHMFSWSHVHENWLRYPRWYLSAHTPAIVLAILAPIIWRRSAESNDGRTPNERRYLVLALLAFAVATYAAYLTYFPYADWEFLRFMLPGIAPLYALTGAVLARGVDAFPRPARLAASLIVLGLTAGFQVRQTYDKQATEHWKWQRRILLTGHYLNAVLPRNAIVMTFFHSGSVRYYTGLPILRSDLVPPESLDALLARLEQGGYHPYLLLDDELERPALAARFPQSRVGKLDWPPRARIGTYGRIDLYDLADPARHDRGERWPIDVLR